MQKIYFFFNNLIFFYYLVFAKKKKKKKILFIKLCGEGGGGGISVKNFVFYKKNLKIYDFFKYYSIRTKLAFFQNHPFQAFLIHIHIFINVKRKLA